MFGCVKNTPSIRISSFRNDTLYYSIKNGSEENIYITLRKDHILLPDYSNTPKKDSVFIIRLTNNENVLALEMSTEMSDYSPKKTDYRIINILPNGEFKDYLILPSERTYHLYRQYLPFFKLPNKGRLHIEKGNIDITSNTIEMDDKSGY